MYQYDTVDREMLADRTAEFRVEEHRPFSEFIAALEHRESSWPTGWPRASARCPACSRWGCIQWAWSTNFLRKPSNTSIRVRSKPRACIRL